MAEPLAGHRLSLVYGYLVLSIVTILTRGLTEITHKNVKSYDQRNQSTIQQKTAMVHFSTITFEPNTANIFFTTM